MAFGIELIITVIIVLVVIAIIAYLVAIFNGLIRVKNNIKKSWANIDVLLKQRTDELPKLINSVKGYMKHERGVLTEITKARTELLKAKTLPEKAKADGIISAALKTLFAVAENYPKLRASENFMQLQHRISGIENELADRREFYNDSVNTYNIRIHSIPDVFVARMMSYRPEEMFKVAEEEKRDVEVKF
ncbi:MAG: LemA family protein [Candidatus Aenigmarchaeota archaeon]|nr:LemA family protein [Candidatus Aenigmarchaeota archaeon]